MGKETGIMWCHHTFNAVWGCTKVDGGCKGCYAETWANRWGFDVWGPNTPYREFGTAHWNEPLKWNRDAREAGVRRRVFGGSMCDPFDADWDRRWRDRLFDLIRVTTSLDWLLLTKRPEHVPAMLPADWGHGWPHVWILASAHDAESFFKRARLMTAFPAHVRGISLEPMVEAIENPHKALDTLDWLIIGGESGPSPREFPLPSARRLMQAADKMSLPVFFKQFGNVLASEYGWKNSKGEDPTEWPVQYRIQEFPFRGVRRCVRCGCTDKVACVGGCSWGSKSPPICSSCY